MSFVTAHHDTNDRSNDLPIYLVLYVTILGGGGRKYIVGEDGSEEFTLDVFLSNFYFYII